MLWQMWTERTVSDVQWNSRITKFPKWNGWNYNLVPKSESWRMTSTRMKFCLEGSWFCMLGLAHGAHIDTGCRCIKGLELGVVVLSWVCPRMGIFIPNKHAIPIGSITIKHVFIFIFNAFWSILFSHNPQLNQEGFTAGTWFSFSTSKMASF